MLFLFFFSEGTGGASVRVGGLAERVTEKRCSTRFPGAGPFHLEKLASTRKWKARKVLRASELARRKGRRRKKKKKRLFFVLHTFSLSSSFFSSPSPGLPPQVLLGAHHVHHRSLRPVVHPRELGLPPRGRELLEASREREVRGRARCSLSCCRRRRRRRLGRCRCLAEALPGAAADVLADVVVGEVGAWGERGGVRLRGQARVYW